MAELSNETLAILDRLKREGKLTRNSENGNSIKTIKISLDKFTPIFENIQNELANLNKTFGQMLGSNPASFVGPLAAPAAASTLEPTPVTIDVESLRAMGLDEETIALQKEAAALNIKNNLEDEKLREKTEQKRKEKEADDRKEKEKNELANAWREKTISGQALTNPLSFFTKLLKGAAIAFVGFNVVRGIVDQWTDGAFTKFVQDIDYAAIGDGISKFTSFLADSPWAGFTAALLAWTAIDFGIPLALTVTGEALRTSMLAKALSKGVTGGIEGSKGFLSTVTSVKGMALTALGVGIAIGGEKLADYVRSQMMGMSPEQIANEKANLGGDDIIDVAGYAGAGATIGLMFGPKGAMVGAILGFAFGIGKKTLDYINSSAAEKVEFDEFGEEFALQNQAIAQGMLDEYEAGTRELTEEQLENLREQAKRPQEAIDAVNDEIGDQRANLARDLERINLEKADKIIMGYEGGDITKPIYGDIRDQSATDLAEREADIASRKEAKLKEIADMDALVAERVAKGLGTELQMTKAVTEGFIEGVKYMFSDTSDILRGREENKQRELERIENFFRVSDKDDSLMDSQILSIIKRIEDGAVTSGAVINVINKGGDVNQFVDASDKSNTTQNNTQRTLYTGPALPTG